MIFTPVQYTAYMLRRYTLDWRTCLVDLVDKRLNLLVDLVDERLNLADLVDECCRPIVDWSLVGRLVLIINVIDHAFFVLRSTSRVQHGADVGGNLGSPRITWDRCLPTRRTGASLEKVNEDTDSMVLMTSDYLEETSLKITQLL